MTAHEHFNMDEFVGQFQTALKVTAPRKRAFLLSWMQASAAMPPALQVTKTPVKMCSYQGPMWWASLRNKDSA